MEEKTMATAKKKKLQSGVGHGQKRAPQKRWGDHQGKDQLQATLELTQQNFMK
jgi:hypothetical protein